MHQILSFVLLFLILEQFILISVPCEAVVYYVKPTDPPNSTCPGQPCQTLDFYFRNRDEYLNSDVVNVTMLLLHGSHTLTVSTDSSNNFTFMKIKELENFEMIGMEPAYEVVLNLDDELITFENVTNTYLGSLTFKNGGILFGTFYIESTSTKQSTVTHMNGKNIVTKVNGTIFNHMSVHYKGTNDDDHELHVMNSTFRNSLLMANIGSSADTNFVPHMKVSNCTFTDSPLSLVCAYAIMEIYNIIFKNKCMTHTLSKLHYYVSLDIITLHCNVMFGENVLFNFYRALECGNTMIFRSTNVTISGNVTFANNTQTTMSSFSSNITVMGNISFVNNTGMNGGAIAMYSSTLKVAANTSVYFINNTATQTGGAIYVSNDNIEIIRRFAWFSKRLRQVPCFYQLLEYNKDCGYYNIQFINNSATNGGDHIYGEAMHSDICYVTVASGFYMKHKIILLYTYLKGQYLQSPLTQLEFAHVTTINHNVNIHMLTLQFTLERHSLFLLFLLVQI